MDDDTCLAGAFLAKYPDATAVEIKQHKRFERAKQTPTLRPATLRFEVWVTLASGHTVIERGRSFDELVQIAETNRSA